MLKKMKSGIANQRGFTLFTALISFVLIFLVVLLVQIMISSERTTSEIISDVEEEQEMQAIADLARADALQAFNLTMREAIEELFTLDVNPKNGVPDNPILLSPEVLQGTTSDEERLQKIKERLTSDFFGGVADPVCISECATRPDRAEGEAG